ncbi:MAG: hypothetical protein A2289_19285 [Deltaproteobacteria bacterium RIFOXYA12_FULL_58_15]|nr:MAG: hypothetical protein A2289_19285 [Deltaproteobacteria bacterium RIFOXYA12_FULL_58_15]OGR10701.1 MAG: hypothetical protein A2341_10110 [Deltaproteobacteria bacterium RIFOXYB12_FULL_58_9]
MKAPVIGRITADLLLVLALLAPNSSWADVSEIENHQVALFERLAPSVVFLATRKGIGSGFFVDNRGLVLTNAHVVADATGIDAVLHDGRRLTGRVVERSKDVDLALVQLPVESSRAVGVGDPNQLRVGSWVASVGHGQGGIWTFTTGMVSNIYPAGAEQPVFQTQIPLNPGNSGGPIVDRHGKVVGIVTAGVANANNVNFGIKIDIAFGHLEKLEHLCDCLVVKAPEQVPIFVDDEMVGVGPRLLLKLRPGRHEVFAVIDGRMDRKSVIYPSETAVELGK